jgi:hypothetical protein
MSTLGLCERRRDAPVSPYFPEMAGIAVLFSRGSLGHILRTLDSSRGAPARSNQKRPRVRMIYRGLAGLRPAGESPAFFPVGPLEQDIQKKVASKNAKRQKQCNGHS